MRAGGASIPEYASTRAGFPSSLTGFEAAEPPEYEIAVWEFLLRDPLFELRLIRAIDTESGDLGLGLLPQLPKFDRLSQWRINLPEEDGLRSLILRAGLGDLIEEACEIVRRSNALVGAEVTRAPDLWRLAAARAILATTLVLAEERDRVDPVRTDPALRDALVDGFACLLDPANDVSMRGFLKDRISEPLLALVRNASMSTASSWIRRRRRAISDAASCVAGDVLLYQARGNGIREFIKQRIVTFEAPVVLLAHSLGGIACVDLLVSELFSQVELLITVGSQAPFLYEIGALHSLAYNDIDPVERLPDHFPAWLNFYDLRDFLSYVGQPVFGHRVVDVQVDNGLPFPDSHGGYFSNPAVWKKIISTFA